RIDRFQVDLARQALYNAQSQLLNSQNIYDDGLDNFKLQYGITPSLNIKIADPMLDHFSLLDPELSALQIRVTEVLNVLREGALADANGGGQKPVAPGNDYPSLVKRSADLRADAAKRIAVAEE